MVLLKDKWLAIYVLLKSISEQLKGNTKRLWTMFIVGARKSTRSRRRTRIVIVALQGWLHWVIGAHPHTQITAIKIKANRRHVLFNTPARLFLFGSSIKESCLYLTLYFGSASYMSYQRKPASLCTDKEKSESLIGSLHHFINKIYTFEFGRTSNCKGQCLLNSH